MDPVLTLEVVHKTPLLIPPQPTPRCFTMDFSGDNSNIKLLTGDRLEALLQMQGTDLFCKHISKWLLNGKALQHEFDIFTDVKGLLYKHIMDSGKQFLALVIPKSWKYMFLVEAHNKLGHQGNSYMYCLIKRQYYGKEWKKTLESILQLCTLLKRKGQDSILPFTDDGNTKIDHSIK